MVLCSWKRRSWKVKETGKERSGRSEIRKGGAQVAYVPKEFCRIRFIHPELYQVDEDGESIKPSRIKTWWSVSRIQVPDLNFLLLLDLVAKSCDQVEWMSSTQWIDTVKGEHQRLAIGDPKNSRHFFLYLAVCRRFPLWRGRIREAYTLQWYTHTHILLVYIW